MLFCTHGLCFNPSTQTSRKAALVDGLNLVFETSPKVFLNNWLILSRTTPRLIFQYLPHRLPLLFCLWQGWRRLTTWGWRSGYDSNDSNLREMGYNPLIGATYNPLIGGTAPYSPTNHFQKHPKKSARFKPLKMALLVTWKFPGRHHLNTTSATVPNAG